MPINIYEAFALSDTTTKMLIGTFEVIAKRNKKFWKLVEDVHKKHMQKYAKIIYLAHSSFNGHRFSHSAKVSAVRKIILAQRSAVGSIIFKNNILDVRCIQPMHSLTYVASQTVQPRCVNTILCNRLFQFRIVFWWYELFQYIPKV